MISIKAEKLMHPSFQGALMGLMRQEMPTEAAIKFKSILNKVKEEVFKIDEEKFELVKKYCPCDEKGSPLPAKDEEGNPIEGSVIVPEEEEKANEFRMAFFKLMTREINIDLKKIKLHELRDAKMTVADLDFLEEILDQGPYLNIVK